jgi:hypothetical protein
MSSELVNADFSRRVVIATNDLPSGISLCHCLCCCV